jgi:GST-like protein
MYKLFAERSPNVFKIAIFLEEVSADWSPVWTEVSAGAQFSPDFIAFSPNSKIPVLIDECPLDGGPPQVIWESGAILQYLASKHGQFLSHEPRSYTETMIWLFWQTSGLGPMAGQNAHFIQYRDLLKNTEYAERRYLHETGRLFSVLEKRLAERPFIVSDYSIADMACFPWIRMHAFLGMRIAECPAIERWLAAIEGRPATARGYARIEELPQSTKTVEERYKVMCELRQ